jgi:hypothetical protein
MKREKVMKKLLVLCLFVTFGSLATTQTNDCNGYFAYQAGTKMDITLYDKKDKVSAVLKYEVKKNTPTPKGADFLFYNEHFDDKGKLLVKADYDVQCKDGQVFCDVRNIFASFATISPNAEVEITGDKLIYPHNLKAGQALPNAETEMKSSMNGLTILTVNLKITNRKVEGFETVDTPAGKFECVKISYDNDIKMTLMKRQGRTIEYLAKGIGVVKSESFDTKGKKTSSQMLTKLQR